MKTALVTSYPSAYRSDLFEAFATTRSTDWTILFTDKEPRTSVPAITPSATPWRLARGGSVVGTWSFLLTQRPDAVVVGGAGLQAAACMVYSMVFRRPVGVWWGGTATSERGISGARLLFRLALLRRSAFFFCYGPESAAYLRSLGASSRQISVLGNVTLDTSRFRARAEAAARRSQELLAEFRLEAPIILSVGRLVPSKNHRRLARTFLRVRQLTGAGTLVLVGEGPERAALEGPHVRILEDVPWERMPDLYGISQVYAHASLYDRWPQAISEALSAGTPIVATRQSGLNGFLEDGRDALLVDGDDEEALFGALLRLSGDESLRERLACAGLETVAPLGARAVADRMSRLVAACVRDSR